MNYQEFLVAIAQIRTILEKMEFQSYFDMTQISSVEGFNDLTPLVNSLVLFANDAANPSPVNPSLKTQKGIQR
jgi:hypothetical protein